MVMPAVRRWSVGTGDKGPTGTARFFAMSRGGTFEHTWNERGTGPQVRVSVTVVRVLACGRRGRARKRRRKTLVYVHTGPVPGRSARWFVSTYKRRFGIETSYRQRGEGLAGTCSTDRRMRLLLVEVALILRNVWVWVLGIQCSMPNVTRFTVTPFHDLRWALAAQIADEYRPPDPANGRMTNR